MTGLQCYVKFYQRHPLLPPCHTGRLTDRFNLFFKITKFDAISLFSPLEMEKIKQHYSGLLQMQRSDWAIAHQCNNSVFLSMVCADSSPHTRFFWIACNEGRGAYILFVYKIFLQEYWTCIWWNFKNMFKDTVVIETEAKSKSQCSQMNIF